MVERRLFNYIKRGVDRGIPIKTLKEELIKNGFEKEDVNEAAQNFEENFEEKKEPLEIPKKEGSGLPTGARICSILYYIQAVIFFLYPFSTLIAGSLTLGAKGALAGGFFTIFLFIILIPFAILFFFVGKGIGNSRKWARIVAIILSLIGLLIGIIQFFGKGEILIAIVNVLVNGFISGYFLFSKKAKEIVSK